MSWTSQARTPRPGALFPWLAVLGALACAGAVRCAAADAATRPSFVFILMDDMGWMDPACYGNRFYETPNIDRLAKKGMRFTDAYAACPVCSPTRASIMSGKYPARVKLTNWIPGGVRRNRSEEHTSELQSH